MIVDVSSNFVFLEDCALTAGTGDFVALVISSGNGQAVVVTFFSVLPTASARWVRTFLVSHCFVVKKRYGERCFSAGWRT